MTSAFPYPQRRALRINSKFTAPVAAQIKVSPKVRAKNDAKMARLQTAVMSGQIKPIYLPRNQREVAA